ncbi:hypothetical protein [Leptolyngbya sp. FACHB-17]|uniref:hypothetical protein n=1 Tax=unclassified Leptolyngbya TaxID=2650499 RepID=UPI0016807D16|nr:hypothetical protein [Leptolyngbya sp. FACHB-17]MBD2080407.1 hypothetical protein [Leptolyngbya sp. FACHB-17]
MSETGKSIPVDWLNSSGEMGKLIRLMDWSNTPLGPIEQWSQSLRTTVSLCLASNFPINIIGCVAKMIGWKNPIFSSLALNDD